MDRKLVIARVLRDFFPQEENNIFTVENEDIALLTEAISDALERNNEN